MARRPFIDVQHPFFKPLWRRVAVVVVCGFWAVVEFATGSPFWGVLFAGMGGYCAYAFFVAFDPDGTAGKDRPE
jgi:hypothetical protein